MDQKVKLQFSCDLDDVPKFSGVTLAEASLNIEKVSSAINHIKNNLSRVSPVQLIELKNILSSLEEVRIHLVKIDNRVADVASVLGGLINFAENPPSQKEEEGKIDDNVSTR